MLILDDYLLLCSGDGGRVGSSDSSDGVGSGRVGDGGGDIGGGRVGGSSSGSGRGCGGLWLLFIVVNILFYYNRYIILLWYLYYFIMLKVKIDLLLQYVSR